MAGLRESTGVFSKTDGRRKQGPSAGSRLTKQGPRQETEAEGVKTTWGLRGERDESRDGL